MRPNSRPPSVVMLAGRLLAEDYAIGLVQDDKIYPDGDGEIVGPFFVHLPEALARRGLYLEWVPPERHRSGHWIVKNESSASWRLHHEVLS